MIREARQTDAYDIKKLLRMMRTEAAEAHPSIPYVDDKSINAMLLTALDTDAGISFVSVHPDNHDVVIGMLLGAVIEGFHWWNNDARVAGDFALFVHKEFRTYKRFAELATAFIYECRQNGVPCELGWAYSAGGWRTEMLYDRFAKKHGGIKVTGSYRYTGININNPAEITPAKNLINGGI